MKIFVQLSERSITVALKQINVFKKQIIAKTLMLQKRIAEELESEMKSGFASAVCDNLLNSGGRSPDVKVSVSEKGETTLVIASGEDAIWCEFGSGIYYNTPVGTSPHPKGSELGFTIGSYGKGLGARSVWGFYEDGELKLTHGTAAQLPMYNAMKLVSARIAQIAGEVLKND